MADCNPANTPAEINTKLEIAAEEAVDPTMYKQLVGSLRYLCNNRPDLSFVVGLISRFINNPKKSHLTAAKRILRYVKGTLEYGILFPRKTDQRTMGYSDSDWRGDKTNRRRTIGYLFKFLGAPISLCSKKKPVVALSSCEAEYIAGSYAACQAIWLDSLLDELKFEAKKPIKLLIDNKSTINLAKNPVLHGRSKHIKTRFHFLREK